MYVERREDDCENTNRIDEGSLVGGTKAWSTILVRFEKPHTIFSRLFFFSALITATRAAAVIIFITRTPTGSFPVFVSPMMQKFTGTVCSDRLYQVQYI